MASNIRIKRSEVSGNPPVLAQGQLAYSALADNGSNGGDRLYIGMGTETEGNAVNHFVIGGKFFTDMLDHVKGTLTVNSAIITDANNKIDKLNVDNITLDGNTFSTTANNLDLILSPHGTGNISVSGKKITNLGTPTANTDAATKLYVDGAVSSLSQTLTFTGNSGGPDTLDLLTETLSILGTGSISSAVTNNTVTLSVFDATTTVKGVASFATANFTVTSGAVSTKNIVLGTSTLTNGSTTTSLAGLQSLAVDNITLDGNAITATNTNGSIILAPNGTGTVDVSNKRITSLATPSQDTDAATKQYVDALKQGLDPKDSVRVATTGNITLSGVQTVDGVALVAGDRVLVKNQTTATQNGIYVVATGAWSRAIDFDTSDKVTPGAFTFVEEGATNDDSGWVLTNNGVITLGTTALSFTQFSGAGQIVAGDALIKTGNTLDVVVSASGGIEISSDALQLKTSVAGGGLSYSNGVVTVGGTTNRITVNATSIDIASTYVGQNSITTLGTITTGVWNGSTIAVNRGGTGITSVAARAVVFGNGTSAMGVTGTSTINGSFLREDATGNPYWSNEIDGGTY